MKLKSAMHICMLIIGILACMTDASAIGLCSVTSVTLSMVNYTSNAPAMSNGAVNWTCSRTSESADGNINFAVIASAGENYNASSRHASYNAADISLLRYKLTAGTPTIWGDPVTVFGSTPHLLTNIFPTAGINAISGSIFFTISLDAGFNPIGGAIYTDIISVGGSCSTSNGNDCSVTAAPLIINVNALASCSLSAQLPTLFLNYTSFQTSRALSSVAFSATCTNATPYRLNVAPSLGTLLGLPYKISLGTSANNPTDISSTTNYGLTGTGFGQTYYINGSISAGLAGSCATGSCTASAPHILNIEY